MIPFALRLQVLNTMLPGRWLCLDGLLDAVLEQAEIPEADRILPLAAFDGETWIPPGREAMAAVAAGRAVHGGSAALYQDPRTRVASFIKSLRSEALETECPFLSDAGRPLSRVQLTRGETKSTLVTRTAIAPCQITWEGIGDPDRVQAMISDLPGIGAKTGTGFGRFADLEVVTIRTDLPGIVERDTGRLIRPVPERLAACLPPQLGRRRIETTRPAYFRRDRAVPARVPSSSFADGILRLGDAA